MEGFLQRLKQRKLVQWALAYLAAAFALIQVIDVAADSYDWPHLVMHFVFGVLALGFVVALVLAWYHGERGAQRIGGIELLIIALLLAIGGGLMWRFGAAAKVPRTAQGVSVATAASASTPRAVTNATVNAVFPFPAASIPEKSVAVLPFENDSDNKDQQYFSDGLSADLITALSQFGGLKVISRDSAFQFRHSPDSSAVIGKKLGVAHLLEGSVQRQGGEVRIEATLVNATDGTVVWSQHYDRPYKDLFALQDAITAAVTDALKAKLLTTPGAAVQSDRPPSGSLAAWNDFQQGKFYLNRSTQEDMHKAISYFTDAIHADPRYALAYTELAFARANLAGAYLDPGEARQAWDRASAAVRMALSLNPDLAAAHSAHAYILSGAQFDWMGAEAEARRAVQLAPNDAEAKLGLAESSATLGHPAQAVALLRQAVTTDPLCALCYFYTALYLPSLGQLQEASGAIHKAVQLQPNVTLFRGFLAFMDARRGNAAAALNVANRLPPGQWRDMTLAMVLQLGPDRAAANAALRTLIANDAGTSAYQIAEMYALRRDPDSMFKWLDRAWENRDGGIGYLLTSPPVLRYKDDPRFAAFCKKVGLPTTTDAKALP
jgi:TolB-like protein/Tfp pilus assembly protein PilF